MVASLHSPARDDAPSSSGSVHRVKVALRTRPLLPFEKIQKARECVFPEQSKGVVTFGRDRAFAFDGVFDQSSGQEEVFRECTTELIDAVFDGYNACVYVEPTPDLLKSLKKRQQKPRRRIFHRCRQFPQQR